jgi:hypothetical protein
MYAGTLPVGQQTNKNLSKSNQIKSVYCELTGHHQLYVCTIINFSYDEAHSYSFIRIITLFFLSVLLVPLVIFHYV